MPDPLNGLSRRRFMTAAGLTAGAVLLGACGGGDDDAEADDTSTTTARKLVLANFFGGPLFAAGQPLRAAFGIADSEGLLPVKDTPEEVLVTIYRPDGEVEGDAITIERHAKGLQRAYFALEVTLDEPGTYSVRSNVTGEDEMSLLVSDPSELTIIQPGQAFPALETPTVDDARGVNPICTREPACPLHDKTAAQALTEGKPMAFLIATPAFCQVTICGPVLDVLLAAMPAHPDVTFLHQEVYADPKSGNLNLYAPQALELGLQVEPCLVLVGSDGKVVRRIDSIYDADELGELLGALS